MATLLVLCRFLHFIVVLLMFGACVFRPWLLGAEPQPALDRQLLRLTRALAWLGLGSGVAWLLLITASMAGSWDAALQPDTVQLVLGKTFFGQVWVWHLLLNLLLVIVLIKPWHALRLPLTALLLATLAPVGHGAMLNGLSGQLLILNQVVHLVCVGAWLGGLLVLVLIFRQPQGYALQPRGLWPGRRVAGDGLDQRARTDRATVAHTAVQRVRTDSVDQSAAGAGH